MDGYEVIETNSWSMYVLQFTAHYRRLSHPLQSHVKPEQLRSPIHINYHLDSESN